MARTRSVKPAFFLNEVLATLAAWIRLLFIGLWTLADRAGRCADRPKRIGASVFPYESLDIEAGLAELAEQGFIERYAVEGERYIQIVNFSKHQHPHKQEPASSIPGPIRASSVQLPNDIASHSDVTPVSTGTEPEPIRPITVICNRVTGTGEPEAPAHSPAAREQPALDWSLEEPFDWYIKLWPGGIPDDCWRTFAEKIDTPEKLSALRANAPLWAATKKYRDGFSDAKAFIRSGVWENPPKAALLDGGQARADERARADEELFTKLERRMDETK